jgi:hypothetical protein
MACVEARSRRRTVEIEAGLGKAPNLFKNDGNGCFTRRDVVPDFSMIKMVHDVANGDPIPTAAVAFDLPNPAR